MAQANEKLASTRAANSKAAISALAMSGDKIKAETLWVAENSGALDKRIHALGVALIIQSMPKAEGGGNFNHANVVPFMQAISAGQSRNRLVAWLQKFSNIRITAKKNEDGSFAFASKLLKATDPDYRKADPIAANKAPFWVAFNEGEAIDVAEFNTSALHTRLLGILRAYDKAKEAGKVTLTAKDEQLIGQLRKLDGEVKARADQQRKVQGKVAPTTQAPKMAAQA